MESKIKEEKEIFDLKKQILEIANQNEVNKHEMRMKELEFQRVTDKIKHEQEMERQRIKSAEIRKDRQYRENQRFLERGE